MFPKHFALSIPGSYSTSVFTPQVAHLLLLEYQSKLYAGFHPIWPLSSFKLFLSLSSLLLGEKEVSCYWGLGRKGRILRTCTTFPRKQRGLAIKQNGGGGI